MMGRNDKPQKPLFYCFNLNDLVPQDHSLRKIDPFRDLSDLRERLNLINLTNCLERSVWMLHEYLSELIALSPDDGPETQPA